MANSNSFQAQVAKWAMETEARLLAVVKSSIQELFSIAQTTVFEGGLLPFDTGFLRNSLICSVNGGGVLTGKDAYILSVSAVELGDTFFGGWTAEYARRLEYGFVGMDSLGRNYNQKGRYYAKGAASQWKQIVDRNATRLRSLST